MSPEELKACGRRIVQELFNQGDLSVADELIAANYVEYVAGDAGAVSGLAGLKSFVISLRAAFPDLHGEIDGQLVDGDNLFERLTVVGTHSGAAFQGIPASGRRVEFAAWGVTRMGPGGKFVERTGLTDTFSMLTQLGVVPADALSTSSAG